MMAVGRPAPLLLPLAFAALLAVAAAVEQSGGLNGRKLLSQSTDWIEPRRAPAHTFFSMVGGHLVEQNDLPDYSPPAPNPPTEPPLSDFSFYDNFDSTVGPDHIHADYAPVTPHPPGDDHDYPPGYFTPPKKTWSSEAAFMHATLPSPTIVYQPENLTGPM